MPRTLRMPKTAPVQESIAVARPRHGWACVAAAAATAGLLWASFFPVGCGWLAWVALVPWLMLVRADVPYRRRHLLAWLAGFAMYVPALYWMHNGDPTMAVFRVLLALYCSWYVLAAFWLIRRLDTRTSLPLAVTVPVVWTALEFARGRLMGGFGWYSLGYTQHAALPVIQVADVAGVAAVTFLVAAVNGLLAEAAGRVAMVRRWFGLPVTDRRPALRLQAVAIVVVLGLTGGYGAWRLSDANFAAGPRVALLQPSIPQTERNAASVTEAGDPLARASIVEQMKELTLHAIRGPDRPDLVIWPETTFTSEQSEVAPGAPDGPALADWQKAYPDRSQDVEAVVALTRTHLLLGLNTRVFGADARGRRYNTALLLTPDGKRAGRYDKMHLVPFGEYIPFRDVLPAVESLSPYGASDYELTPGERQSRLPLTVGGRTYHLGVLICYEDADPPLARQLVRPGDEPVADFIVNISNDGWFMGTAEHAEHLAVSRFRAVECRRALVRAVNGGISAVVDGNGRVVAQPAETWARSHSVTAVVTAAVPLDTRASLYARAGDWLPWTCWGLLLIGCVRRPNP